MKKFLAVLLAVVMVVPMALVANAETVTKKPFYGLSSSAVDESAQDNIRKAYTLNTMIDSKTGRAYFQLPGVGTDIDQSARAIAQEMDRLPEGMRRINLNGFAHVMRLDPVDAIYLHNGAAKAKAMITELIEKCYQYNAKLEGVMFDYEYLGVGSGYITLTEYPKDNLIFHKIVQNPNYATMVRPLLEERGFDFYPNPTEYTPEIWGVNTKSGDAYAKSRAIWDTVMGIHMSNYLNEAVYEPIKKYYPDITINDDHSFHSYAWNKEMNGNGEHIYVGGNNFAGGNISSTGTYFWELGKTFTEATGGYVYNKPGSYAEAIYEANGFNQVLLNINNFKNYLAASPNGKIDIRVAEYDYPRGIYTTGTAYWTETLLHIGLMDPQPFFIFMYAPDFATQKDYDDRIMMVSEVLSELTRVAGYSDRKVIQLPTNWNTGFVLSGMYANGRNIWRLTPDITEGLTLEDFKVEGNDPTFSYKGQTITFPGGKIIEDGYVSVVGTCGYWIETDKDVMPVVTVETDRFEKFPAFLEDFESYEAGKKFTASDAKYADTWVAQTKSKDPAMIITDGDNQVMELTGTTWLVNEKILENITAGDYYAQNQEWRVTATIPANMGEGEEVVLLKYTGAAQSYTDGGFKVAGGKVYYDKEGEYVEIPGLDVSAGGTYIFKRVLHFSEDGFTSDYHVLNAEGKAIAGVKGITVADIKLPVQTITIGCKGLSGKLLLDNYSLNAYGIHTGFELFGAKLGMPVEDAAKAQSEATAYRLAWQNNTANTEATAKIVAEFYENGNKVSEEIIKELKMAPGCDGVVTGIVEVKDGQSVKLSLLSEEKKLSADNEVISGENNTGDNGNEDNGDNNETSENPAVDSKPAGMNIGLIAGIAVAVVAMIAVVVVIIVKKSAKKKVSEETETPEE